jgi:hypothetical protein
VTFQIAGDAFIFIRAMPPPRSRRSARPGKWLHSDGSGVDSGNIDINLPQEALNWLKACGKTFDIAIDKVSDPDAPPIPTARPARRKRW